MFGGLVNKISVLRRKVSKIIQDKYVILAGANSPWITVYPWSSSGFGTKYANPAALPGGLAIDADFSSNSDYVICGGFFSGNTNIVAYPWSNSGFGTKFANPSVNPPGVYGLSFSPDTTAVTAATTSDSYIHAWPWSSSGFGTKFANPSSMFTIGGAQMTTFSPDGSSLAVGTAGAAGVPAISVYAWSSSGFGTRFSNPSSFNASSNSYDVKFTNSGNAVANTTTGTGKIEVWSWSSSGFGTKFSDASTPITTGSSHGCDFHPNDSAIVMSIYSISPYIHAYAWSSSGFGTKFANPSTLPAGNGWRVRFSGDGNQVILAHESSPYVTAYAWSSSGFGTKFANPTTLPNGGSASYGINFG